MNQYKIGDTVWTRKRGKCRVICEGSGVPNRPYRIMNDNGCFFYPKAENLYPSEAAMNLFHGRRRVTIDFSCLEPYPSGWMTTDPIQPKFKVGDAVYYKGKKYTIRERYWSGEKWKYNMTKPIDAESGNLLIGMNESDLRLWKETVLTHGLHSNETWVKPAYSDHYQVQPHWVLSYLGKIIGYDTFLCTDKNGIAPALFRGIKGDDI